MSTPKSPLDDRYAFTGVFDRYPRTCIAVAVALLTLGLCLGHDEPTDDAFEAIADQLASAEEQP